MKPKWEHKIEKLLQNSEEETLHNVNRDGVNLLNLTHKMTNRHMYCEHLVLTDTALGNVMKLN